VTADAQPDGLILEIAVDDTFLHVGRPADVLTHATKEVERLVGPAPPPSAEVREVEFFDTRGRPLVPQVAATLRVVGLRPRGRGSIRGVERRVRRVLDHAQAALDVNPSLGDRGPALPPATSVPRPPGDLAEMLESLAQELALDGPRPDRGGWFHNLMHAAGWTHS
jgi:hypothetical protein